MSAAELVDLHSPQAYLNRELSWLSFARRVIALAESAELPLLERVKFAGIAGMLHDEFFMKRVSGLKQEISKGSKRIGLDGKGPAEELVACRAELQAQVDLLDRVLSQEVLPALAGSGIGILHYDRLDRQQRDHLRDYFQRSVLPILTPLAVDKEHPFPFISNLGLNLAVLLQEEGKSSSRFVRIKVPNNRPRWITLPGGAGFAPLEQVIAANLRLLLPESQPGNVFFFRVTRGARGETDPHSLNLDDALQEPGSIVQLVSGELKARRFAGVVRLEVDARMPKRTVRWLATQLGITKDDVFSTQSLLGLADFGKFEIDGREELRYPRQEPVTHERLAALDPADSGAIFEEVQRGDILLHHPYHSFDTSVLRLVQSAALDPAVLAIKLTIYRTSSDSPIVRALVEAARRGKQVAVLVEITARFDEAPNIAWGEYLENEGIHVSYGVERLKTHVKLALVIREEAEGIRRYVHVGTGNYHSGTARIYEDLGILTCEPDVCRDVAAVFNSLTGATPSGRYKKLLVAPAWMRKRFITLIRREARHARRGKRSGIKAKMNQLQDPEIIRELYLASRVGVPISLNVRGLCCLRPGVPGLSENIRVFGIVGRFLEHSRIYRFENDGNPEYYLGSADWMKRNLDSRVETIIPALDPAVRAELGEIIETYEKDNSSAWDAGPDGTYVRRTPPAGEERRAAQEIFIAACSARLPQPGETARRREPQLVPRVDRQGHRGQRGGG